MRKFTENLDEGLKWPQKSGWYWVLIDGWDTPTPCWIEIARNEDYTNYALPGGMGDSSSMGLYDNDIEKFGPEIIVPNF